MADPLFVDDTWTWTTGNGLTLSDRVWNNRGKLQARIEAIITDGIERGASIEEVGNELIRYVMPSYARSGDGTARYAAQRLAGHEMRRAHAMAVRDTAIADPAGGLVRYRTSAGHALDDECTDHANRVTRYGVGVYRAQDAPMPPRHVGCRCYLERFTPKREHINAVVDRLRVEYGLDHEPTDLSPSELAIWRRETQKIKDGVVFLFRGWLQQTGLVSREQITTTSSTVARWVAKVKALKARLR